MKECKIGVEAGTEGGVGEQKTKEISKEMA